jgi:diketogulonate reductase-like aldo/keto reductase
VVTHALRNGYRQIDSAAAYRNEGACGAAILASSSTIPRSDIFFTSKIPPKCQTYEAARDVIASSLAETGLGYVDLYLIHAPFGGAEGRLGVWRALREAQIRGEVRSIGVSNFGVKVLEEFERGIKEMRVGEEGLEGGGKIDVGQWEVHPWLPRGKLVEWCRERGVVVQAYCPLVRGLRAEEEALKNVARKHGKTWAQVLVRWSLQMVSLLWPVFPSLCLRLPVRGLETDGNQF